VQAARGYEQQQHHTVRTVYVCNCQSAVLVGVCTLLIGAHCTVSPITTSRFGSSQLAAAGQHCRRWACWASTCLFCPGSKAGPQCTCHLLWGRCGGNAPQGRCPHTGHGRTCMHGTKRRFRALSQKRRALNTVHLRLACLGLCRALRMEPALSNFLVDCWCRQVVYNVLTLVCHT
jgi:hypothetical protein